MEAKEESLRVGEISFTNTRNLYYYLRKLCREPGIRYLKGTPAQLNCLLRSGEIDLCVSSSIEYAYDSSRYLVLPGYGIASRGPLPSIRLFSRVPLERLDGATICLTTESATSVALCRVLLGRLLGQENRYVTLSADLEDGLAEAEGLVLIGDRALAANPRALQFDLYIYDLSLLWQQLTGLPFVFALWIIREDSALAAGELLSRFWRALIRSHELIADPDETLIRSVLADRNYFTR
ncbi:MAG: menaquinone biosynthesis protein, partial [Candidatus Glassbacteria bacterium]